MSCFSELVPTNESSAVDAIQNNSSPALVTAAVGLLTARGYTNAKVRALAPHITAQKVSYYRYVYKHINSHLYELWFRNGHKLSLSHIRSIVRFSKAQQEDCMRTAIAKNLSSKSIEALHRGVDSGDYNYEGLGDRVSPYIGQQTLIAPPRGSAAGTITISWHSLEELEGIFERFGFDEW